MGSVASAAPAAAGAGRPLDAAAVQRQSPIAPRPPAGPLLGVALHTYIKWRTCDPDGCPGGGPCPHPAPSLICEGAPCSAPSVPSQISRILVQFSPYTGQARSAREFLARVTSQPARQSNPDCEVQARVRVKGDPFIEIQFDNKQAGRCPLRCAAGSRASLPPAVCCWYQGVCSRRYTCLGGSQRSPIDVCAMG
jgi:hypothetical protein